MKFGRGVRTKRRSRHDRDVRVLQQHLGESIDVFDAFAL